MALEVSLDFKISISEFIRLQQQQKETKKV